MSFAKSAKEGDILIAEAIALNVSYKLAEFEVNVKSAETQEVYYRFKGMVYRKSESVI